MAGKDVKLLRRAQTISPFGVGTIIEINGESFVPADITHWGAEGDRIHEERLEKFLGVDHFRMAPPAPERPWEADANTPGVPCVRFPAWFFCPRCRRMYHLPFEEETPVCEHCSNNQKLIPMRFVMACPRGHLSDIPWDIWAHSKSDKRCKNPKLIFKTNPGGSGLEYLEIYCTTCQSHRSLEGITRMDSLRNNPKVYCPGTQPWQSSREAQNCDAVPQVLQRGATNLTFAVTHSSIDIPPFSAYDYYTTDRQKVIESTFFSAIKTAIAAGLNQNIEVFLGLISNTEKIPVEQVRSIVNSELNISDDTGEDEITAENLLSQEYDAFLDPEENYRKRDRFVKRTIDTSTHPEPTAGKAYARSVEILKECIDKIVQVTRLREVRVLEGFSRLSPHEERPDDEEDLPGKFSLFNGDKIKPRLVKSDLDKLNRQSRWLPAVEVFGEGVFITLNEAALQRWENLREVQERARILEERRIKTASYLQPCTPRLLLLHTLSHLLITQLSFECGYSLASLRERVYADEKQHKMAGILIYTAAGDSEGTLGGLVRQGLPHLIFPLLVKTVQNAMWCSNDPLCHESTGQGMNALNLAACHACALLPETSCTMSNRLLDRTMITGNQEERIPGFFTDLCKHITDSMSTERFD